MDVFAFLWIICSHYSTCIYHCWSYIFTSSWQSSDQFLRITESKTFLRFWSSPSEGEPVCFIAYCNGQYTSGGFMKLWFYKCQRGPLENNGCVFSTWPANPHFFANKPVSLFLFSHGGCYSLPALDPLLGLDLFVWQMIGFLADWPVCTVRKCVFVWYLNQTAAGSGPGVCVIKTFKCTYGEMRAKLWVLCYLLIFCFSFNSYYYLNLRD